MQRISEIFKSAIGLLISAGIVISIGSSILNFGGTIDTMPGYAAVYLDDANRTYLALPCLEMWQSRKTTTVDILRLAKASEAYTLKYDADEACKEQGWFAEEGDGWLRHYAVAWGVLSPKHHWWDDPYRTEDGSIVYPKGASTDLTESQ